MEEIFYYTGSVENWVCPDDVYFVKVECYAGGAGSQSDENESYSGGGGAFSMLNSFAAIPGTSYDYYVGAGGAASNDGEDTYFKNTTTCLAEKGYCMGSSGGQATNGYGDVKYNGGNGGFTQHGLAYGGGGCGGLTGNGGDGSLGNPGTGGTGGGGLAGNGGDTDEVYSGGGENGFDYGGGGGGKTFDNPTGYTGANGVIRLTYLRKYRSWEGSTAHNYGGGGMMVY